MSEQWMPGVPMGYRLRGFFGYPYLTRDDYVLKHGVAVRFHPDVIRPTNDLLPVLERIEKPRQYEFVVVIPADVADADARESIAGALRTMFSIMGGTVTLRPKGGA